jgi:hypothetical protein
MQSPPGLIVTLSMYSKDEYREAGRKYTKKEGSMKR